MDSQNSLPLAPAAEEVDRPVLILDQDWWLATIGCIVLLALALIVDRLPIISAFAAPSGADPGNWLAFAWDLSGDHVRLASWAYPPATFWLLRLLLALFAPLTALKVLGFMTWLALGTSFLLVLRWRFHQLPFYIHLGLSALFMLAGYQGEIYAWGGYPQLLGLSFLLLGLPLAESWLQSGRGSYLLAATLLLAGVIYTHHLLTAILPLLLTMLFGWCWLRGNRRGDLWRRGLLLAGLLLCLALPVATIYLEIAGNLAGNPLNAHHFDLNSAPLMLNYVFQDSLTFWLVFWGIALILPLRLSSRPLLGTLFAVSWGTVALQLLFWEVRLLQLATLAVCLGLAVIIAELWHGPGGAGLAPIRQLGVLLGMSVILFLVLPPANQWFQAATDHGYRSVDGDFLAALDWLAANTGTEERVLAAYNDLPQAWWVEGYSQRQVLYATDPRWLFFSDEQEQTAVATAILDPATDTGQVEAYLRDYRIHWLFVDKSTSQPDLTDLPHFDYEDVFENDRMLIIHIIPTP